MFLENYTTKTVDLVSKHYYDSATRQPKENAKARFVHLAMVPGSLLTTTFDIFKGTITGLLSILTLGKIPSIWTMSKGGLDASKSLLARPYFHLISAMNPKAFTVDPLAVRNDYAADLGKYDGYLHGFVYEYLDNKAIYLSCSTKFFHRHISSRLAFAVLTVATVITRVADGIIGTIATPLSLITLGHFEKLNNVAYRSLQATGIISDLFYCAMNVVNPLADFD